MSNSGDEELTSRRRPRSGNDDGFRNHRSRGGSDYDDSMDSQTRRKERSPYRKADHNTRDEDYSRRNARHRHDRSSDRKHADSDYKRDRRSRSREHRHRSRSPPTKRRRRSESTSRSPPPKSVARRSRAPLPSQADSFHGNNPMTGPDGKPMTGPDGAPLEKQKPNYKPTGLLAKEANTVSGTTTVLKYHEPPEARKPPSSQQWRIYVFKGKDLLDTIHLHTRSAWLLGRDEKVTDYLIEHPSASKQHAVIQFRYISKVDEFGTKTGRVKPYLIDLESVHGTRLNGKKIAPSKYTELLNDDVVTFGESEREYVVMLPEVEKKS